MAPAHIEWEYSTRIPWIDVAWHDKFILYGAGYSGRYAGGLDQRGAARLPRFGFYVRIGQVEAAVKL